MDLQGFLNFLVYQRPHYLKLRKMYPSIGRIGALRRMLRFTCLPEPEHWKQDLSSTYEGTQSGMRARSGGALPRSWINRISSAFRYSVSGVSRVSVSLDEEDEKT